VIFLHEIIYEIRIYIFPFHFRKSFSFYYKIFILNFILLFSSRMFQLFNHKFLFLSLSHHSSLKCCVHSWLTEYYWQVDFEFMTNFIYLFSIWVLHHLSIYAMCVCVCFMKSLFLHKSHNMYGNFIIRA